MPCGILLRGPRVIIAYPAGSTMTSSAVYSFISSSTSSRNFYPLNSFSPCTRVPVETIALDFFFRIFLSRSSSILWLQFPFVYCRDLRVSLRFLVFLHLYPFKTRVKSLFSIILIHSRAVFRALIVSQVAAWRDSPPFSFNFSSD